MAFTYSGPSTSAAFVAGVFNDAWGLATQRSADASKLSTDTVNMARTPVKVEAAQKLKMPPVPNALLPGAPLTRAELGVMLKEDAKLVGDELTKGFSGFLNDYFGLSPEFSAAQAWLQKALSVGGTGMSLVVESQIFERERSRILMDAARAEEELTTTWAARRWPTPPGALRAQVARLNAETNAKLAAAARDVAVQQAGYEIENTRFAVKTAIDLRTSAVAAAGEYMRALTLGRQLGISLSTTRLDFEAKVVSLLTDYYKAQITASELPVREATYNIDTKLKVDDINKRAEIDALNQRVNATMAAAQSLGTQAAAALNALHAQAGIGAQESL